MITTKYRGWTKAPNWLLFEQGFTCQEVRLLLILKALPEKRPTHTALAKWTNLDIKTVKKVLIELRSRNVITWLTGNGMSGRANIYTFKPVEVWRIKRKPEAQKRATI